MNTGKRSRYIPPADIILDMLNEEDNATEAILNFYDGYIASASIISLYDADEMYEERYKDEDLMQEIRVAVIKALPPLRCKLKQLIDGSDALVIVIR